MVDYGFVERISTIFTMIFSSIFFIALFVILVLAALVFILSNKIKNKIPKYLILGSYFSVLVLVLIKYGKYILSLNDSFINKIFSMIYFPNIISYICMLLISILIIIITFIRSNYDKVLKIGNVMCFSVIQFLFILILDVVKNNDIDIYSISSVYSDRSLMILLQSSTSVFLVWMGVLLFYYFVEKSYLKIGESDRMSVKTTAPEVPVSYLSKNAEEVKQFSDADFNRAYNNLNYNHSMNIYNEVFNNYDDREDLGDFK